MQNNSKTNNNSSTAGIKEKKKTNLKMSFYLRILYVLLANDEGFIWM